jgi:hypothetical protein
MDEQAVNTLMRQIQKKTELVEKKRTLVARIEGEVGSLVSSLKQYGIRDIDEAVEYVREKKAKIEADCISLEKTFKKLKKTFPFLEENGE